VFLPERVTRKTSYVVGTHPGSNFARAQKLGIETIDEAEFLEKLDKTVSKL